MRALDMRVLGVLVVVAVAGVLVCDPTSASAQSYDGYRIDRLRPPPGVGDGLAMPLPRTAGDLVPTFGLVIEYGHEPLRARSSLGGQASSVVASRVVAHVLAGLGVTDRVELHLRVPVAFSAGNARSIGEMEIAAPDVATVADPAIGGSVRLVGESEEGFNLGLMAEVLAPLTAASGYASDREVSARGMLTLSAALPAMTIALAVGASYRPERQLFGARSASELDVALGLRVPAFLRTDLMVEVILASGLRDDLFFASRGTSLEVLAGGRYRFENGLALELGGAMGFLRAPGTPAFRAFLGVRWETPPPGPVDLDADGFVGDDDRCPTEAEDRDQNYDDDGCPEPDDDEDGIADARDSCPRAAEDADHWDDEDGCPDTDDDEDGWEDAEDHCPRVPGGDSRRGCPRTVRLEDDGAITLLQEIVFESGTAQLVPTDGIVLDEIAAIVRFDRDAHVWRVGVRAIRASRREDGVLLANERAAAIRASLLARHVPAERLVVAPAEPPPEEPAAGAPFVTLTLVAAEPSVEAPSP